MGEHKFNPVAQANAVAQDRIEYLKIGDGYGLLGVGLQPFVDSDGVLHVLLIASCARISELVPINKVIKVALGEAGTIATKDLCAKVAEAIDGPTKIESVPEIAPS